MERAADLGQSRARSADEPRSGEFQTRVVPPTKQYDELRWRRSPDGPEAVRRGVGRGIFCDQPCLAHGIGIDALRHALIPDVIMESGIRFDDGSAVALLVDEEGGGLAVVACVPGCACMVGTPLCTPSQVPF